MTVVENCPNCGGTHIGHRDCPFTLAKCVVCDTPTVWACSDCAIEGKRSVHVCNHDPCRREHERLNPQHPVTPTALLLSAADGVTKP